MKKIIVMILTLSMLCLSLVPSICAASEISYIDVDALTDDQLDELLMNHVDQRSSMAKSMGLNYTVNSNPPCLAHSDSSDDADPVKTATLLTGRTVTEDGMIESYVTIAADYQDTREESDSQSTQSLTAYVYIYYDYKFENNYQIAHTRFNKAQHKMVVHSSSVSATSMRMKHDAWGVVSMQDNSRDETIGSPVSGRVYTRYAENPTWWSISTATYEALTTGYTSDGGIATASLSFFR